MDRVWIRAIAAGAALIAFAAPSEFLGASETVNLVILHVNDTHGQLRPSPTNVKKPAPGIARMATLVRRIRRENPGRVLLVHAGDVFSRGGPLTVHYGGETNLLAMQSVGYQAMTPGNGEFYFSTPNLLSQAAKVRFPLVMANLVHQANGRPVFEPFTRLKVAGVRVALLGLGFVRTSLPSAWDVRLTDPVAAAREHVPRLRGDSDLLVALTHIGHRSDKRLAAAVPELDIVIGGHSHSVLRSPVRVQRPAGLGAVTVAQAGDRGRFLGRLDVRMAPAGAGFRVTSVTGKLIPVGFDLAEAPDVVKLLDDLATPLGQVVCRPPEALDRGVLTRRVVEHMRVRFAADVAMLDTGAIQRGAPKGELRVGQLCRIHPWRNRVFKVPAPGARLVGLLANKRVRYAGRQLRQEGQGGAAVTIAGQALDPNRTYTLAVGEYVLAILPALRALGPQPTGRRVDHLLAECLRTGGPGARPTP